MRRRILRLLLLMFAAFILPACAGSEKAAESENEMFDTHTKQFLKYAEKYGLIESAEYQALEDQLEKENDRRKKAVEQGEVIYGPTQYTMETYIKYICGSMEPELIEKMKGKEISCTEEDVRAYYEDNKEYIAVQEAAMQFDVIMTSQENKELLEKIAQEDDVIKYAESDAEVFTVSEMEFQENSVVYNRNPDLMEQLFGMKSGDRYLTEDIEGIVYLYVYKGETESCILPYEQVRESVENMYLRAEFDEIFSRE